MGGGLAGPAGLEVKCRELARRRSCRLCMPHCSLVDPECFACTESPSQLTLSCCNTRWPLRGAGASGGRREAHPRHHPRPQPQWLPPGAPAAWDGTNGQVLSGSMPATRAVCSKGLPACLQVLPSPAASHLSAREQNARAPAHRCPSCRLLVQATDAVGERYELHPDGNSLDFMQVGVVLVGEWGDGWMRVGWGEEGGEQHPDGNSFGFMQAGVGWG